MTRPGRSRGAAASQWARWPDLLVTLLVTAVVLGPLLLDRGFVLVGDMVFVPHQPWKDAWTGGDGGVPRAVPSDAWVSLLTHVIPGDVLQRLVLVAVLVGAGLGVSRLTAELPVLARLAAVVLYLWNPYVHERLAIGHWALLCGYAALPWAAWAVTRLRIEEDRRSRRRAWAVLLVALAVAGWASPTGGVLAAVTAAVLAWGRTRLVVHTTLVALAVNLPWLVPAFANGADQLPPDAFGVEAFAARADTPFGAFGSVLTFGGIWKESIVPQSRGDVLMAGVALALVLLAVWGLWTARRRPLLPLGPAVVLAVGAVLLACLGTVGPLRPVVEWVVLHVPGGGLVRDGQKWVAPWVLVAVTGVASAVSRLLALTAASGKGAGAWLVGVVLAPVVALPTLALGLGGFLHSDPYPDDWAVVGAHMEQVGLADDLVVVLPFATYRRFDWTPRTVLDPAPRWFPGRMVTEDALTVPQGTVGGESALAARVRAAGDEAELAQVLGESGVSWALVHRSAEPGLLPAGGKVEVATEQLTLLRLSAPTGAPPTVAPWRPAAYATLNLVVLCTTAGAALRLTLR